MDQTNVQMQDIANQVALEPESANCPVGSQSYTVQRGDSFYLIARKFGVSVRALMNANPAIAAGRRAPVCAPRMRGKIRLPAPKNRPKSMEAIRRVSLPLSFVRMTIVLSARCANFGSPENRLMRAL